MNAKKIGTIAALTLLPLGFFFFLDLPKMKGLRDIKAKIRGLEKDIQKAQKRKSAYREPSQGEETRFEETEDKLRSVIPSKKDVNSLNYEFASIANKNNISDITFTSGDYEFFRNFLVKAGVVPAPARRRKPEEAEEEQNRIMDSTMTKSLGMANRLFDADLQHFFFKIFFNADYRELAGFLDEIQDVERYLEIEYLRIYRNYPSLLIEIVSEGYYNLAEGA